MEEKRQEDQSEEVDSSTLKENSKGAAPVRKLKQSTRCSGSRCWLFSLLSLYRQQKPKVRLQSPSPLCCQRPCLLCCARARAPPTPSPAESGPGGTRQTCSSCRLSWGTWGSSSTRWRASISTASTPLTVSHPSVNLLFQFTRCFSFCSRSAKKSSCWWTNSMRRKGFDWLCRCAAAKQEFQVVCWCYVVVLPDFHSPPPILIFIRWRFSG